MLGKGSADDEPIEIHFEPVYISSALLLLLNIIRPAAGLEMAPLCVVVILGGKKPLVLLLTSNSAVAAGVAVPMPTCAWATTVVNSKKTSKKCFINFVVGMCIFFIDIEQVGCNKIKYIKYS